MDESKGHFWLKFFSIVNESMDSKSSLKILFSFYIMRNYLIFSLFSFSLIEGNLFPSINRLILSILHISSEQK